jgi:hypothetical protein
MTRLLLSRARRVDQPAMQFRSHEDGAALNRADDNREDFSFDR